MTDNKNSNYEKIWSNFPIDRPHVKLQEEKNTTGLKYCNDKFFSTMAH
jgi:hypothetical protein